MEGVLPFDGANFLRLLKPHMQALCVNLGRVASNPSQFSVDHIGGQPPKAQAQVRVDRACDDKTRPEGVRVRDVERTGTRNQLKLELAPEPGRLDLDPLGCTWPSIPVPREHRGSPHRSGCRRPSCPALDLSRTQSSTSAHKAGATPT